AAPDFVIGDRYGASAALWVVETLEQALRKLGYSVRRNKPYAGGFITEHYGAPASRRHAVQIEINRALYMDERTVAKSERWTDLAVNLQAVVETLIVRIGREIARPPLAAE
ncbi:MAG TPA: N-formylglutamate amidohydrolase, partial [Roseiarcus sp.]|nr:N-formylglutamate amidohydrolase [Roseiarcus sp.]